MVAIVKQIFWDLIRFVLVKEYWQDFKIPYLPNVFGQTGLSKHVDPDEMLQNVVSHQGLHCLPLI